MDPAPGTSDPDSDMYGLKLIVKFMEENIGFPGCEYWHRALLYTSDGPFPYLIGW